MASMQEPAPGGKSAKFVNANPLAPMVDPFQHLNDEQRDMQQELSENVNKRVTKAMEELKEKHANGTNEVDDPDRAPTGAPYRQIQQQKQQAALAYRQQQQREQELAEQQQREEQQRDAWRDKVHQNEENGQEADDGSDDEFNGLLDDEDDPILDAIRQKRLLELKSAQAKRAEHLALGHGELRTITQDELLPECTGSSEWVAIHFFHKEFERCQIMDHHLKQVAPHHLSCKFLRIDAENAPFFVSKLVIRTLPTLIVFREGKAVNRLTGFEGLASALEPDNFPTSKLKAWLAETGCIKYDFTKDALVREELLEERRAGRHGAIYSTVKELDALEL